MGFADQRHQRYQQTPNPTNHTHFFFS
uniref:Uncharacterized protein n=1 Tax=Lotus japonicus TaxID=34305 RepID=I3T5Z9_LOTJA|nr:unknown [Lotus japonicus]